MIGIKPRCDFCSEPAVYDGKTIMGPWAHMCEAHFNKYGVRLPGLFSRLDKAAPVLTKKCLLCRQVRPIEEFYEYTDSRGVKRYRTECKTCNLEEKKRRRFKK